MRLLFLVLLLSIISLFANAQKYDDYNVGYVYDLQNVKSPGLIKWTPPVMSPFKGVGDHLFFKLTEDDTRQKVETDKIQSFVMVTDSFVVSHQKDLEKNPILRVLLGKDTKLYVRLISRGGQGAGMADLLYGRFMREYYYGPDPDHVTELSRKNFAEVMPPLIDNHPDIAEKIRTKEITYGDIDKLLKSYFKGR